MKMVNKIATLIVVGVLSLAGLILFGYNEFITKDTLQDQPVAYEIINEWQLPKELDEVSGIDWVGDNKLACIQDEDGIIFIFNLETSKVEKSIENYRKGQKSIEKYIFNRKVLCGYIFVWFLLLFSNPPVNKGRCRGRCHQKLLMVGSRTTLVNKLLVKLPGGLLY